MFSKLQYILGMFYHSESPRQLLVKSGVPTSLLYNIVDKASPAQFAFLSHHI